MGTKRMLHKKISISFQVNKLSLPAQLLFTWMISHADDDGRLKGEPEHIRAMVVPMKKWSFSSIKKYLLEMSSVGLIYYWERNSEWFVEFAKWKEHQTLQKDRYKPSDLPTFNPENGNNMVTENIQNDSSVETQDNISKVKDNKDQINKGEQKDNDIADKKSPSYKMINPKDFTPNSSGENMAFDTWKRLEPQNPLALQTTYLKSFKLGLPEYKFGEFASQIEQDPTIKNKGAVFQIKVTEYLIGRGGVQK